jgi:GSH-dependent disulfide-bond oxidoreductase
MIELYFWTTDNGRKALQAAEESGLPYTRRPVNLQKRENFAPEFMKISPGHKIPALTDDQGPGGAHVSLCESGAILKYLAEKAGSGLYPTDARQRVKVDQWFFYGSSTFTPWSQQYGLFMHRFGQDIPPAKKYYGDLMLDMFGILDKHLASNEYLADKYSIADIACYPDVHIHGAEGAVPLGDFANLKRWHDAITARPAVQKAWAPI